MSPSSCIPAPQGPGGGNQGMEQSRAPQGPQHPTDGISQLGPVPPPCRNTQEAGGGSLSPRAPPGAAGVPGPSCGGSRGRVRKWLRFLRWLVPHRAARCQRPALTSFRVVRALGCPPPPLPDTPGPRHSRQIWQGEEEPLAAPSKWRRPFKAIPAWPGTRGDTRTCARSRLPLCVHTRVRRGCSRRLCRAAAPTRVQAAALLAAPRIPHASGPARGGSSFWPPPRGLVPVH